ncbi:MAG TPA: hypothetical protein VNT32_14010 [Thermoleophilaceae bacterium]|nr:hypothetical protein [Thermoleophilaceae bacterium]
MKLYVCWGTFAPDNHPCGQAHRALVEAGHDPEVVRAYGWGRLPEVLNQTPGRREVRRRTGNSWVPALVTDGDETIQGTNEIVAWAKQNPAA